jgi:hypothetical protein
MPDHRPHLQALPGGINQEQAGDLGPEDLGSGVGDREQDLLESRDPSSLVATPYNAASASCD